MPDIPLFKASTPGRLNAGIWAGLTLCLMKEIVLFVLKGSAHMPMVFQDTGCGNGGGLREGKNLFTPICPEFLPERLCGGDRDLDQ